MNFIITIYYKILHLKGGTALNFLYLDLPRLSIDLDFNYTGATAKEEMTAQRQQIELKLKKIASTLGYTIKERGSSYIISRNTLQYTTIRNTKDHAKIEINYLQRLPLGSIETMQFPSLFPDFSTFKVKTYMLEELTAQKIIASLMRTEPRLYNQNIDQIINYFSPPSLILINCL